MTLNKMQIIGNLGGDPQMRYTQGGDPVTNFSVAVNNNYTRSDGSKVEETEWFRVSTWRKQAESCNQYLSKGSKVYVEGKLKGREWTGEDGAPRFSLEINADRVVFLSTRDEAAEGPPAPGSAPEGDVDKLPW